MAAGLRARTPTVPPPAPLSPPFSSRLVSSRLGFRLLLVFSLSVSVSLSLISLAFFLPESVRKSLVELLSLSPPLPPSSSRLPYPLSRLCRFPPRSVLLAGILFLSFSRRVASGFPNFSIFSYLKDERRTILFPSPAIFLRLTRELSYYLFICFFFLAPYPRLYSPDTPVGPSFLISPFLSVLVFSYLFRKPQD